MRRQLFLSMRAIPLFAAIFCVAHAEGQEPRSGRNAAGKGDVRHDRGGLPLPAGAIARFGSMHLRHEGLTDFVFLSDGQSLLTAGIDLTLRYWDLNTGQQERAIQLPGKIDSLPRITLSPNGKVALLEENTTFAGFGGDKSKGRLAYFDLESGRAIKTHEDSASWVIYRELSPDGSHAATARWISTFRGFRASTVIQNLRTGQEREVSLRTQNKDRVVIYGGGFAPNGKWYAVAGNVEFPLRVIELATGKEVCAMGKWNVAAHGFSADSGLIAVSCMSEGEPDNKPSIRLLKLPSGEQVIRIPTKTHFDALALSHDGKIIACAGQEEISLIDCASGTILRRIPGDAKKLLFSGDDKTLVWIGTAIRVLDVASGKQSSLCLNSLAGTWHFLLTAEWLRSLMHRTSRSISGTLPSRNWY